MLNCFCVFSELVSVSPNSFSVSPNCSLLFPNYFVVSPNWVWMSPHYDSISKLFRLLCTSFWQVVNCGFNITFITKLRVDIIQPIFISPICFTVWIKPHNTCGKLTCISLSLSNPTTLTHISPNCFAIPLFCLWKSVVCLLLTLIVLQFHYLR